MKVRAVISGGVLIALLAGGALAFEAAPQAAPAPQTLPAPDVTMPATLATTRALFASYVAEHKLPGIVGDRKSVV